MGGAVQARVDALLRLTTAALVLALLLAGLILLEPPRWRWSAEVLAWPLVGLGRNALLAHFGSHAMMHWLTGYGNPDA